MTVCSSGKIALVETKKGNYSLKVTRQEDGKQKTLHSLYDPVAEAKSLVDSFEFDGKGILVVLGLGLAYHVSELSIKFPDAEIVVIEALPEICELAKEHGPEPGDRVEIITGLSHDEVLRKIRRSQTKEGMIPLSVFSLSAAVSSFHAYYSPILEALKKTTSVKLWERLKYNKFTNDNLNVLLIDSGYFLLKESEKALQSLGHKVRRVRVRKDDKGETVISSFVEAILDFKPDFLLTVNHLGFDEEGVLTSLFRSIEMPVASWYVDSPRIIINAFDKNVSPFVSVYMWDNEYRDQLETMGFESVNYLPLGTDDKIFRPMKLKQRIARKYDNDISFVGNSMVGQTTEKMQKIPEKFLAFVEKAAYILSGKRMTFENMLASIDSNEKREYECLSIEDKVKVEAAVLWRATLLYRLSCIEVLKDTDFRIYGDSGWQSLLKSKFDLKPPVNYYKDLPHLYNTCNINFNATHLQMGQAVNQRVFDVPACGSFLLTDNQEQLNDLFKVGEEIIAYDDREQISELADYYLRNPEKRKAIAARGHERVMKEHTYRKRLDVLTESMKKRYG